MDPTGLIPTDFLSTYLRDDGAWTCKDPCGKNFCLYGKTTLSLLVSETRRPLINLLSEFPTPPKLIYFVAGTLR